MAEPGFHIEPLEHEAFSEADWESYFELCAILHNEAFCDPEDTPTPQELEKQFITDPDPNWNYSRWVAWNADRSKILSYTYARQASEKDPAYENNRKIVQIYVKVVPEARRNGLGTEMIRRAVMSLKSPYIESIETYAYHPQGHDFCKALGGELSLEAAVNRLKLCEVDWKMIHRWSAKGPERAPGVQIDLFYECPEEILEAYCEVFTDTVNQQPLGQMGTREVITPERVRQAEERRSRKGIKVLTMYSREPDGAISGLTETLHIEGEPHKVHQMLTGVQEQYRGKGLGKWLKAEMLLYIREHFPAAKAVYTGNADENAPMLSINNRMGFQHYMNDCAYKFDIGALRTRLNIV